MLVWEDICVAAAFSLVMVEVVVVEEVDETLSVEAVERRWVAMDGCSTIVGVCDSGLRFWYGA